MVLIHFWAGEVKMGIAVRARNVESAAGMALLLLYKPKQAQMQDREVETVRNTCGFSFPSI